MKKLEWYALEYDFNTTKLKKINVLNERIIEDLKKRIKRDKISNYKDLKSAVTSEMRYRYWCKAEHEMLVSDLWNDGEEKIDVWYQIELNIDRICEYVIKELKLKIGE